MIHIIPASTLYQSDISLPLTPMSVSIGPDGTHAAVGHNGWISYVNLDTLTVEQTFQVTCEAFDIVLAGNGFIYVFPLRDQWEQIRCINISTGLETLHTGNSIYDETRAKLHPSGKYIYGANNGLSPSDFEKYNIQPGTAAYMYDSPYHGTYAFSGNIWISDDGLALFARSGNIFRATESQSNDMTYFGSLSGVTAAEWVDHSTAAGYTYAVNNTANVYCYNNTFYALQKTIPIAPFINGASYQAQGKFVFVSSDGGKALILSRAVAGSGLYYDWGLSLFYTR